MIQPHTQADVYEKHRNKQGIAKRYEALVDNFAGLGIANRDSSKECSHGTAQANLISQRSHRQTDDHCRDCRGSNCEHTLTGMHQIRRQKLNQQIGADKKQQLQKDGQTKTHVLLTIKSLAAHHADQDAQRNHAANIIGNRCTKNRRALLLSSC
jgi:hypothetical protein